VIAICFVCLGNICRSPTAEGVMRKLVADAGLEHAIAVDSAGTSAYHIGEAPDSRARAAANLRGIELTGRARQFTRKDFARFDYVVAMDRENLETLLALAPDGASRSKVHLLRAFDPKSPAGAGVPDPYYGGSGGFDEVLEIVLAACRGLLERVRRERDLS
jgi:protein-tyrosine phosphatase